MLSTSAIRLDSQNEMLTVGPWPRTKEERERAAKKYNLIPEDYEPFVEGECFGDYPNLKAIGRFNRDPYDDFDDPYDRRHYGEVYHVHDDLYQWERIDPLAHEKGYPKLWFVFLVAFLMAGSVPTLHWTCERYKIKLNHPYKMREAMPKGQKYYDFPPSLNDLPHHHHH